MMRYAFSLAISIHLAAPAHAQAPVTSPPRAIVDAAYRFGDAKQSFVDNYVAAFAAATRGNAKAMAALARRPGAFEWLQAIVRAESGRQYDLIVGPALTTGLAQVYEANFSAAELRDLAGYYRTPEAQRLLSAFASKTPGAVAAAQADPVVQRYLRSPAGQKEQSLSAEMARAMTSGMTAHANAVNLAVLPKVRAAMEAALAPPRKTL